MCSRFFRKNIENWKLTKIFQKNHARTWACHAPSCQIWRRNDIAAALWKNDKILTENRSKIFRSEICHFCTGRPRSRFVAKFDTMVHDMLSYVHDFFRNFSTCFEFSKKIRKKRVHVHPGTRLSFACLELHVNLVASLFLSPKIW